MFENLLELKSNVLNLIYFIFLHLYLKKNPIEETSKSNCLILNFSSCVTIHWKEKRQKVSVGVQGFILQFYAVTRGKEKIDQHNLTKVASLHLPHDLRCPLMISTLLLKIQKPVTQTLEKKEKWWLKVKYKPEFFYLVVFRILHVSQFI